MKNEKFIELKINKKQFLQEEEPSLSATYKCREELVKVMNKFDAGVGMYAISMIVKDLEYAYGKENVGWLLHVYKEWYDGSNASNLTEEEYKKLNKVFIKKI